MVSLSISARLNQSFLQAADSIWIFMAIGAFLLCLLVLSLLILLFLALLDQVLITLQVRHGLSSVPRKRLRYGNYLLDYCRLSLFDLVESCRSCWDALSRRSSVGIVAAHVSLLRCCDDMVAILQRRDSIVKAFRSAACVGNLYFLLIDVLAIFVSNL